MYENITYNGLMERMLKSVTDRNPGIDTREGSIIWDALAPAAIELMHLYIQLDVVLDQTFADTASREYLMMRCKERGILPYPATHAILKGIFDVDVPIGSRFSLNTLNYEVIKKIDRHIFELKCETSGSIGNRYVGDLIPINYITGLKSAKLTNVIVPGEDEEETENLRKRYMDSFDFYPYGGNIKDYEVKTNAIPGVGGVKVYPVWNGGGTVKLVIIGSDFLVPSHELVVKVEEMIQPTGGGEIITGTGIAPIGHSVTVIGVVGTIINFDVVLDYESGWKWKDVEVAVKAEIDAYFIELGKIWENEKSIVVRTSQIELRLLGLNGILDVLGVKLNGASKNMVLDANAIPVRGVVCGV